VNGTIVMRIVLIMSSVCGMVDERKRAQVPLGEYAGYVDEWG
jgi:hypothetical protein